MDLHSFRILSLCSGVGGLELGLKLAEPNARTVAYVEIEAFACEILATRMQEQALDEAPIWTNIKTFNGKPWRGKVDCISGGYPCQPFSVAGKKLGDKDPRHLWPHVKRIVEEINPPVCFFENVGGHLRLGFEQVHDDLSAMGYTVKTGLFTAEEVGAPHKRERLFILAHRPVVGCDSRSDYLGERHLCENFVREHSENQPQRQERISGTCTDCQDVANSEELICKLGNSYSQGLERRQRNLCNSAYKLSTWPPSPSEHDQWEKVPPNLKPAIHRMADGLANRVDRIRACGNGVVPLAAAYAWRALTNGMYLTKPTGKIK
ncbi:MAG: DNA cytosine methyltransferase [Alphaproteobacteria bacterium]